MLKINPGIKESAAVLRKYLKQGKSISPELSTQSIADEIALYGLSGKYKKLVINEGLLNFPWVEKEFKVIETDTRIVVFDPRVALIPTQRLRSETVAWVLRTAHSGQFACCFMRS